MITEIKAEQLIEMGQHLRTDYLVEQGGYTLGIAAKDGAGLAALLPAKYIAEVRTALETVSAAMKDKALMAAEAKSATISQNTALAGAKIWRKKAMHRSRRAVRMGKDMPNELVRISAARTVPKIIGQLDSMIKLLESNKAALGADTAALIKQGQDIAKALKEADANQEVKKLKDLPEAVRTFYLNKGMLYIGLKVINDAGRELYADKPEAGAVYNLSILHRRHTHGNGVEAAPQATETK
ncbi:MAG: hypothetical protein AB6733_24090 [Clostridiaceae bacterium]